MCIRIRPVSEEREEEQIWHLPPEYGINDLKGGTAMTPTPPKPRG